MCLAPAGLVAPLEELQQWGWRSYTFPTAEQLIQEMGDIQADLLILVPGATPRLLVRQLEALLDDPSFSAIPGVLFLSGADEQALERLSGFAGLAPLVHQGAPELMSERLEAILEDGQVVRRRPDMTSASPTATESDPAPPAATLQSEPEESAPSRSTEMYDFLESLSESVTLMDSEGRLTYANQKFRDTFGMEEPPVSFEDRMALLADQVGTHPDVFVAACRGFMEDLASRREITFDTIDGRHFRLVCQPFLRGGVPDGKICVFQDLTEQQQLEDQLRQTRTQAEEANRAKSAYLSTLSHELRTPLNSIVGFAELLRENHQNDEDADYIDVISSNAEALLTLINQMLDLSRIEAGKLELDFQAFDLEPFIQQTIQIFLPKARVRQLEMAVAIDPDVPTRIISDNARLRQILVNLLGNAIKFTEEGSVELLVEASEDSTGGSRQLRFRVRDTGPGIPEGQLDEVFRPFSQLRPIGGQEHGGSGLGLAISRELAQMLGGSLWIQSEKGYGATLVLEIEVEVAPDDSGKVLEEAKILEGQHLLVVDEVEANRRTAQAVASMAGMRTSSARDWASLLEVARQDPPQIVLADMRLFDPDPDSGLAQLRKSLPAETPVLLTLPNFHRDPQQGLRVPSLFADILLKPLTRSDLLRSLVASLRGTGERPAKTRNGKSSPPAAARPRVLLAEDDADNQRLLTAMLQPLQLEVIVAQTGSEALDRLRREKFSAAIIDIRLPDVDGIDVIRQVRAGQVGDAHKALYIVAVTAHTMVTDEASCLQAGADAYLTKPLSGEDLRQALTAAVEI